MDLQRKVGLQPVVGIKDRTRAESGSQLLQGDALGKSSSEAKICSATRSGSWDPSDTGKVSFRDEVKHQNSDNKTGGQSESPSFPLKNKKTTSRAERCSTAFETLKSIVFAFLIGYLIFRLQISNSRDYESKRSYAKSKELDQKHLLFPSVACGVATETISVPYRDCVTQVTKHMKRMDPESAIDRVLRDYVWFDGLSFLGFGSQPVVEKIMVYYKQLTQ